MRIDQNKKTGHAHDRGTYSHIVEAILLSFLYILVDPHHFIVLVRYRQWSGLDAGF